MPEPVFEVVQESGGAVDQLFLHKFDCISSVARCCRSRENTARSLRNEAEIYERYEEETP